MSAQPFHPLILELADDLADDLSITEEKASAWVTRLSAHTDGEEIATHLAVLAMRLGKQGAAKAAAQLVAIAQAAFNASAAATIATAAGVELGQTKKLTGWSSDPTAKRVQGLAAPIGGVGPRRKK